MFLFHQLIKEYFFFICRSSLRPELYTPAYGGFFEFDLEKEKTISLRTLVSSVGGLSLFPVFFTL